MHGIAGRLLVSESNACKLTAAHLSNCDDLLHVIVLQEQSFLLLSKKSQTFFQ